MINMMLTSSAAINCQPLPKSSCFKKNKVQNSCCIVCLKYSSASVYEKLHIRWDSTDYEQHNFKCRSSNIGYGGLNNVLYERISRTLRLIALESIHCSIKSITL